MKTNIEKLRECIGTLNIMILMEKKHDDNSRKLTLEAMKILECMEKK